MGSVSGLTAPRVERPAFWPSSKLVSARPSTRRPRDQPTLRALPAVSVIRDDSDSTTNPSLPPTSYYLYTTYLNVRHTFEFDYVNHADYVEGQLTKSGSSANPGLMAVQICNPAGASEEN